MTLSADLAQRLSAVAVDLPATAVESSKSRLLHALGVALASGSLPAPRCAWDATVGEAGDCVAIGRATLVSDRASAFHNAVAVHGSLLEDCGPGGLRRGSHPSTYVIPAAMSAAEHANASGRDLIAAIVIGYEAVDWLGAVAPPEIVRRGFRPVPVAGPLGAAAAAATIYHLDARGIEAALSLAVNLSSGLTQGFLDGTMEPYFHAGFGAANGLQAAKLACAGAITAPSTFEGPRGFFATFAGKAPEDASASERIAQSTELAVSKLGTKRFPSCVQNQVTMALILDQLRDEIELEAVESVTLTRPLEGANGLNSPGVDQSPPYQNMLQAQMSARFTAAAALLRRPVESTTYFAEHYDDRQVTALADKISLIAGEDDTVTLTIQRRAGQPVTLVERTQDVLYPSASEIRARFLARAEPHIGVRAAHAASVVEDLDQLANARELTSLFRIHCDRGG